MEYLSLKEVCSELSISLATGRNWLKLEKLKPIIIDNKKVFDKKYIANLKKEILDGKNTTLKSRRNKKFVSGTSFYKSYVRETSKNLEIIQNILSKNIKFNSTATQTLIADYAIKQLSKNNDVLKYLRGETDLGIYNPLIDDIISDKNKSLEFIKNNPEIFHQKYFSEPKEDILGLIYISTKNLGARKSTGSYYTPTNIVEKLVNEVLKNDSKVEKILDPACGTGNFLLKLPDKISLENIYGNDLDLMSVKITRLNLAIKFKPKNIDILYENITNTNFLKNYDKTEFDYIIGNPPWGAELSQTDTKYFIKKYGCILNNSKTIESYDIFIEEALNRLKKNGQLAFVLPEAILSVKAHKPIRKIIVETTNINYLSYLNNRFDKVQCPSIILNLTKTNNPISTVGLKVETGEKYVIKTKRAVDENNLNFLTTDEEHKLLEKLLKTPNALFLEGNADFALGIVTGDNKNLIAKTKTKTNEIILKGTDIKKFKITPKEKYIEYTPQQFQQVAPTEMYKTKEKLLYRFISKKLVFAYDDCQRLSLNSCNILIPKLEGISIKYIMAILNSNIAQFIFEKKFNSLKVLRSHIEQIPIPVVDKKTQNNIINMVDEIINSQNHQKEKLKIEKLNKMIEKLFGINEKEEKLLTNALSL